MVLTLGIEIFGAALFGAKIFGADRTHWQGCNWLNPIGEEVGRTLLSFDTEALKHFLSQQPPASRLIQSVTI